MFFYLVFIYVTIPRMCHGKIFILNDSIPTKEIGVLTTATEVQVDGDKEYRYPCYVSVGVYKTPDLNETVSGATVTVLTRHRVNADEYYGYSTAQTDRYGHACALTLCRKKALVFVETGSTTSGDLENLYAVKADTQKLPPGFTYDLLLRNEEVLFSVRNWGTVFGKTGPVYNLDEKQKCIDARLQNYHFTYSYISIKESLTTNISTTENYKPLAWYYADPLDPSHQVCYMKVKVKIPSYQAKLTLKSYSASTGDWYGTFVAGPKASPTSQNTVEKAACMEFRCPTRDIYDDTKKMNTTVVGSISTASGKTRSCTIVGAPTLKSTSLQSNSTTFNVTIHVDDNYGADDGIYKNSKPELAKAFCYTGSDNFLGNYKMNPDTNFFISYDCS